MSEQGADDANRDGAQPPSSALATTTALGVNQPGDDDRSFTFGEGIPDLSVAERALRDACRDLSPAKDAEERIPAIIAPLVAISRQPPRDQRRDPPTFRRAGRRTSARELERLSKAAERMIKAIEALHGSTINALADQGFGAETRTEFPKTLETLRKIIGQVERADVSGMPTTDGLGRRPDHFARCAARLAGDAYLQVTGERPTYTTDIHNSSRKGRWPTFLAAVFEALGVECGVDVLAHEIAVEIRESMDTKIA